MAYENQPNHNIVHRVVAGNWAIELLPAAPYETRYTPATTIVGFSFDSQTGTHAFASDIRHPFKSKVNSLAFIPAGCEVYSQSDTGGEYLRVIRVDKQPSNGCVNGGRFSNIVDRYASSVAHQLRYQLRLLEKPDNLVCEALAYSLYRCVNRHLGCPEIGENESKWMTPFRLKIVQEMVEEGFSKKVRVADLANALGLSTGFFTRAFTATVGRSPQEYIIGRRISHAIKRITETNESLSAIACTCGFASHSHMTSLFQMRFGYTPSHLRA